MIKENTQYFSIRMMCRILSVSVSGYYEWLHRKPSDRASSNQRLLERVTTLFKKARGRHGAIRLTRELRAEGHKVGKNRVGRLMRKEGLVAKAARKFKATTNSNHKLPVAPNLLEQNFLADKPNQKWVSDITYSVPGVQHEQGSLNEPRVYLEYTSRMAGASLFVSTPGCAGV